MNDMTTATATETAMKIGNKKVALVIDDDRFMRLMMGRALRPYFDAVYCAYDSTEAAWFCESYPVTHIIIDYDLGEERTGPQLVMQLKELRPGITKVILCSGSQFDPSTLPKCIDAYVLKNDGLRGVLAALRESASAFDKRGF
jgi:CheY-like chemotaxis protein